MSDRTVVDIAECPPITDVAMATIIHDLTFGRRPELDGEVLRCSPTGPDL